MDATNGNNSNVNMNLTNNVEGQSLAESLAIIRQLQTEIESLNDENSRLNLAFEEECVKSAELSEKIDAEKTDAEDRRRLLATVENDKQALSRALAQNKELKNRLAELQEGLMGVNEEKCRLATQWETEKHALKEAKRVLTAREDALERLSGQLEAERSRADEAEGKIEEILQRQQQQYILEVNGSGNDLEPGDQQQQQQLNETLVAALQRELSGSQDAINALTEQNAQLRDKIIRLETEVAAAAATSVLGVVASTLEDVNNGKRESTDASEAKEDEDEAMINELLRQRDALANRYEDTEEKCKALTIQLETLRAQVEANASFYIGRGRDEEDHVEVRNGESDIVEKDRCEEDIDEEDQNETDIVKNGEVQLENDLDDDVEKNHYDDSVEDDDHDDDTSKEVDVGDHLRPATSYSDVETQTSGRRDRKSGKQQQHQRRRRRDRSRRTNSESSTSTSSSSSTSTMDASSDDEETTVPNVPSYRDSDVAVEASGAVAVEAVEAVAVETIEAVEASGTSFTSSNGHSGVIVPKDKYDALNDSMEKLTKKFLVAMRENAELEDKASRLEHVVEQLEGETETIGDYITLYHAQRKTLKARADEKDAQIVALVREKRFMQDRVAELTRLLVSAASTSDDQVDEDPDGVVEDPLELRPLMNGHSSPAEAEKEEEEEERDANQFDTGSNLQTMGNDKPEIVDNETRVPSITDRIVDERRKTSSSSTTTTTKTMSKLGFSSTTSQILDDMNEFLDGEVMEESHVEEEEEEEIKEEEDEKEGTSSSESCYNNLNGYHDPSKFSPNHDAHVHCHDIHNRDHNHDAHSHAQDPAVRVSGISGASSPLRSSQRSKSKSSSPFVSPSSSNSTNNKKESELARIRQILSELAEGGSTAAALLGGGFPDNLVGGARLDDFYPCKCCHGKLINV